MAEKENRKVSVKGIEESEIEEFKEFRKAIIKDSKDLLTQTEKTLLDSMKLVNIREKAIRDMWGGKKDEFRDLKAGKTGAQTRSTIATPIELVGIHDDVLKKLNFGKSDDEDDEDKLKTDKQRNILTDLIKLALPLIGVGAAFIGSLKTMFSGGPLQGVATMMTKVFADLFTSLGSGIIKIFNKGNFIRNFLENLFGTGKGAGNLLKAGKTGAKAGSSLFKVVGKGFLKRIPIIGSLISLGSAVTRFKKGEVLQGLIDIGAATATMFPGVGTGIAVALDLLNASIDINDMKNPQDGGGIVGLGKSLSNWYMKKRYDLPVIGTLTHLGDGIGMLLGGDVKGFFNKLLDSGLSLPFVSTLTDFLFGNKDSDTGKTIKGSGVSKVKDMYQNFMDSLIDKIRSFLSFGIKGATEFLNVPTWASNKIFKALGFDEWIDKESNQEELKRLEKRLEDRSNYRSTTGRGKKLQVNQIKRDRDRVRELREELDSGSDSKKVKDVNSGVAAFNRKQAEKRQEEFQKQQISALNAMAENFNAMIENQGQNVAVSNSNQNINSYNFNTQPSGVNKTKDNARSVMQGPVYMPTGQ